MKTRIYIVRTIASRIFEYRISRTQSQLDALNKQRDETIEKLKVATKYNSTQQLLEKYGGDAPSSPNNKSKTAAAKNNSKRKDEQQQQQQYNVAASSGRTGLPPPPTANIKRRSQDGFSPSQSQQQQQLQLQPNYLQGKPLPAPPSSNSFAEQEQASFAPNAFPPYPLPPPSQSQYDKAAAAGVGTKWYDRFLDVLLGEDETSPKNRIVLICQNCRLVNGQAPPGVKGLDELGKWRCGGCGAWNGEESEAKKVLDSIQQESASEVADEKHAPNVDGGEEEDGDEEDEAAGKKEEESTSDDKSDEEEQVQTTGSNSDKKQQSSSGVSTRTRSKRAKK